MPGLRIPAMSFSPHSVGQSRNRPSSDSRGGHVSSNSWWQEWNACTKRSSYLRPCLKTSYHHPSYGHNNTFPSHVKNTLFLPLRTSKYFILLHIISESRTGVSQPQHEGQIQPVNYFCTAPEIRMAFIFHRIIKNKSKQKIQQITHVTAKLNICTIWHYTETFADPWSRILAFQSDPSADVFPWVWFLDCGSSDVYLWSEG